MNIQLEKFNLCTCNLCNQILIDTNPQTGAKEYFIEASNFDWLEPATVEGEYVSNCCPNCKTDEYLTDDVDETKLK